MLSPVIEQHFARLKERYPTAALRPLTNGAALITVAKCPLPAWQVSEATISFIAPNGYSVASPDNFWVEPNLYLDNQAIPKNSGQNNQIPEVGIAAHWFSWHVEAERWAPNVHDLLTWLTLCFKRLQIRE